MSYFKADGFSFELGRRTYIMGILNITDNSFYDGGKYNELPWAVGHARRLESEGADIIDVGANSTKPGITVLTENEELEKIKAFLPEIIKAVSVPVSVDTFYPSVAEYALENGAGIINDVSGKINPDMLALAKRYSAGLVLMHNPLFSSSAECDYSNQGGVTGSVGAFFDKALETAKEHGIDTEQLMLDVGIGFSKSYEDSIEIMKNLSALKREGTALLCALSMKRMTSQNTGAEGDGRLYSTVAADTLAISAGADFLRVHHVKEAVIAAKMADEIVR